VEINMQSYLNPSDLPLPYFSESDRQARILDACAELEPIFRRYAHQGQIPGVAYGVMLDGELLFDHAFGVANVTSETPVDADTVFRIASMTKSFAALAILQLRDAGQLRLDEPIATYVPEFVDLSYPSADSPLITVRHLLTMSAGWPEDNLWGDRQLYRTDDAMRPFFEAGVSWSNPPGITFEYSNYAYMVLGRIITNVAGAPAISYINERILKPLGMDATVWNVADVPAERLALGYRWEDDVWKEEPLLPSGGDVAAFAGLFTSVRDLARWVGLFQSAWPPRNDPEDGPLCRSSLREMQQRWRPVDPRVTVPALGAPPRISAGGYGYGLFIQHNGAWESVGHGGGLPGFGSYMCWAPAYGVGIVALGNITYANMGSACVESLEKLLKSSGVKPRMQPVAPALERARQQVIRLLAEWDESLAESLFADNFFLDRDRDHWRCEWSALREKHGDLTPDGSFAVENWLRGEWRMAGERGWCQIFITLTPAVPPLIQALEITSTLPPSPALQAVAEALAALTARPTRRELARLCAATLDREPLWDQIRLANILCGPCTVGEVTGGDGVTWARVTFTGSKQNTTVTLHVDSRGKLVEVTLRPVRRAE
jgi:CubicO group peptidase (beta-lactamase class C family)